MKKRILIALLVLFSVIVACHKDQPEMNTFNQGCDNAKEVNSEFTMEEIATQIGVDYEEQYRTETDTIYEGRNVRFHALEDNAEYTWYIGSEVLHERTFYRQFNAPLAGQTLPITLVVKKNVNEICFPNDDGYDSITKNLIVTNAFDYYAFFSDYQWRWEGMYRFKDVAMGDSVDIKIELGNGVYPSGQPSYEKIIIYNYDGMHDTVNLNVGRRNYRQLFISGADCFSDGYLKWMLDDVYELKLPHNGTSSNYMTCADYHYFGRKLN